MILDELDRDDKCELIKAWQHTAFMAAVHANINRDTKKKREPFTFADFMPVFDDEPEVVQELEQPMQEWEKQFQIVQILNDAYGGTTSEG